MINLQNLVAVVKIIGVEAEDILCEKHVSGVVGAPDGLVCQVVRLSKYDVCALHSLIRHFSLKTAILTHGIDGVQCTTTVTSSPV